MKANEFMCDCVDIISVLALNFHSYTFYPNFSSLLTCTKLGVFRTQVMNTECQTDHRLIGCFL